MKTDDVPFEIEVLKYILEELNDVCGLGSVMTRREYVPNAWDIYVQVNENKDETNEDH